MRRVRERAALHQGGPTVPLLGRDSVGLRLHAGQRSSARLCLAASQPSEWRSSLSMSLSLFVCGSVSVRVCVSVRERDGCSQRDIGDGAGEGCVGGNFSYRCVCVCVCVI